MKIHLLLFAVLAEQAGHRRLVFDLPDDATVADALSRFFSDVEIARSAIKVDPKQIAFAVNMEYVSSDHLLREGDEVALIPPVSGG